MDNLLRREKALAAGYDEHVAFTCQVSRTSTQNIERLETVLRKGLFLEWVRAYQKKIYLSLRDSPGFSPDLPHFE